MSFKNRNFHRPEPNRPHRINNFIRSYNVRVIFEGQQLGVMSTDSALRIAAEKSLDLVELVPDAKPPVCHIINYEKYLYKIKIKEKKNKVSVKNDSKEIRFKSCIHDHDLETKANQAKSFLSSGKKVQINLRFKSFRELNSKERGFDLINKFLSYIGEENFSFEKKPFISGDQLFCKLLSKNQKN